MSADPPRLDEAIIEAMRILRSEGIEEKLRALRSAEISRPIAERVVRAVLAFATSQPRPITERMVEGAAKSWLDADDHDLNADDLVDARAALEAAEKAIRM